MAADRDIGVPQSLDAPPEVLALLARMIREINSLKKRVRALEGGG